MKALAFFTALAVFLLVVMLALPCAAAAEARELRRHKPRLMGGLDEAALLRALRQRESGDNPAARGTRGERTAYQFMPATWRIYTRMPFEEAASDPAHADRVAAAHLAFLVRQHERRGWPVTPANVAAMWKHGPWCQRVLARGAYAEQVENLYREFAR